MEYIWIIGCGRFGKIALDRLSAQKGEKIFMVVDPDQDSLPEPSAGVKLIEQDGVSFLKKHLEEKNAPDWIIPAVPVHLAARWCISDSGALNVKACAPPGELKHQIPNPVFGPSGDVYTSYAEFKCPDNCPEPEDHCPATGKKREQNLFEKLQQIEVPGFEILVVRSRQLAPGVGGYKPEDLFGLQKSLSEKPGRYLIATACRCHGVITPVIASSGQW
ncbi:MAG: potassium transporter [Desulfobacterales bacterium]